MWIQEKYRDFKKFKRSGKLISLGLPKDAKLSENLYKLNIKPKSIDFVKGNGTFIITDEIGISDATEFSFFFTDDVMCIRLDKGILYVRETDGTIYSINNKHKVSKSSLKNGKIAWKTIEDLRVFVNYSVKDKYNLATEGELRNYRNNLLYYVYADFYPNQGNLFTMKFLKISESLGGPFNFVVREKVDTKVYVPMDIKENNLYEDMGKPRKKVKNYPTYDDYDDTDDLNVLPDSMHEIDIFNDYVSLED